MECTLNRIVRAWHFGLIFLFVATQAATAAIMPPLSSVKTTIDSSFFPVNIGSYYLQGSEFNKQNCSGDECVLTSTVIYDSLDSDKIEISVTQGVVISDVFKDKNSQPFSGEINQVVTLKDFPQGLLGFQCGFTEALVCITPDKKNKITIKSYRAFLSKKKFTEISNNPSTNADEVYILKLATEAIPKNEVVNYVLKKISSTFDKTQDVKTSPDMISVVNCTNFSKNLLRGQESEDVLKLQQFLFSTNYLTIKPNGYFGSLTVTAVKKFQLANGLSPVGSVGQMTRAKIKDVSCAVSSAGNPTATKSLSNSLPPKLSWDFNSNVPFILKFSDFNYIKQPDVVFQIILPDNSSKKIKKIELIEGCSSEGRRTTLFDYSVLKNYSSLIPGAGLLIPAENTAYWGDGGYYFMNIIYTDSSSLQSKKVLYTQIDKPNYRKGSTEADFVKYLNECKLTSKVSTAS